MRWTRLDIPGTDACELVSRPDGWRVEGVAEFGSGVAAARLEYVAEANRDWETLRAEVRGTAGARSIEFTVERSGAGAWRINGADQPAFRGLIDLDLGFTPATNIFPLRRLALDPGKAAAAEAVWLDDTAWAFRRLPQRYERRSADAYWYESPTAGYADLLVVGPDGFVREYPGLWTAVDHPAARILER